MKKIKILKKIFLGMPLFSFCIFTSSLCRTMEDIPLALPTAVIAADKDNKPVGFCRINKDRSLVCFDKQAKEFYVGNVTYNGKLHPAETKNNYILNLLSRMDKLTYSKNITSGSFFYYESDILSGVQMFILDDTSDGGADLILVRTGTRTDAKGIVQRFVSYGGTAFFKIPPNIYKKMYKLTPEEKRIGIEQAERFRAATEPGYNDPNHGSAGRFFRSGPIYSGTGGQIGRIGSDGTIYSGTGGQIGKIDEDGTIYSGTGGKIGRIGSDGTIYSGTGGQIGKIDAGGRIESGTGGQIGRIGPDGRVYSGTGGQVGRVPSGDNAVAAYSMVAKAQGMRNPFPGL